MLRTVGLCVIVISGIGCGFAMSNELGRRKKMMEMILRMIILLRGEIRYGNKSLYDAFTETRMQHILFPLLLRGFGILVPIK